MKSETKKDLLFIFNNIKSDWLSFIVIAAIRILIVVCSFATPMIQSLIIDCGLNFQPDQPLNVSKAFEYLVSGAFGARGSLQLVIILAVLFTISVVISDILKNLQAYYQAKYRVVVRKRLIKKSYLKFCMCNKNVSNSEALNYIKDDITGVGEVAYANVPAIVIDLITMLMAITTLSQIQGLLLIVPLLAMPLLLYFNSVYIKKIYQAQLTVREQKVQLNSTTKENIEGIKSFKLFNITSLSKQRFKKKNTRYVASLIEKNQLSNKYSLIFNVIKKCSYIISIVIGGLLAIYRYISIGEFLTFTTFVVSLLDATTAIGSDIANAQINMALVRKSRLFLESTNDISEISNPIVLDVARGYDLTVNRLSLDIDNKKTLQNINFMLPKGKTLGIIGGSGDGKSALVKTFMRLLPISSGSVWVGDALIENIQIKNMRDIFSYHMQSPMLFNISIRDNLLYSGNKCSDERIKEVIQKVYCEPLFSQVSSGYDYQITDNGNSFGLYKTRLCLARNILKESQIYIFDDIFSSYDATENKTICKNIRELLPNKSLIFLTNNYDNVKSCDYILQLKKGKIVYYGDSSSYNKLQKEGGQHE